MFLCNKKILYLSVYRNGKKEESAGFIRFTEARNECRMDIQVKKGLCPGESHVLYFIMGKEKAEAGMMPVQAGGITFSESFQTDGEKIFLHGKWYDSRRFSQIQININAICQIAAFLPEVGISLKEEEEKPIVFQENERKEDSSDFYAAGIRQDIEEVYSFDNKWDQLTHEYPQIHPFGDERLFISIEPKDFIVLRSSCQKLVNNSFLLHGFYNYRYLILGPDKEMGNGSGDCFYLGVPGTYFEREKMVAVMFGFEGFECAGPAQIGKFGFYMRRVEI